MFSRTDYEWLASAWAQIIDSHNDDDQRYVVHNACAIFAQLLAKNSVGFDPTRFMSNVNSQLTKLV
jgi:hypothetical protein